MTSEQKRSLSVDRALIEAVYDGDDPHSIPDLIKAGDIDRTDPATGMTALHIAVGSNDLHMTQMLVEAGAAFMPDAQGRMPSVIAAEMEVSEQLADYIYEAESRALKASGQEDV